MVEVYYRPLRESGKIPMTLIFRMKTTSESVVTGTLIRRIKLHG